MSARTDFPGLAGFATVDPPTPVSTAITAILDYVDALRADLVWQYVSTQAAEPARNKVAWKDAATRAGAAEADADRLWAVVVALRGQATAEASPAGQAHATAIAIRPAKTF